MHRFSACLAVGAMFFALVAAPLVHVHDSDDHGNALVHTHFLESENPLSDSGHAIETQDSHHQAHWIDVFTSTVPAAGFYAVAEFSDKVQPLSLEAAGGMVCIQAPCAHSPPDGRCLVPRSPPAL